MSNQRDRRAREFLDFAGLAHVAAHGAANEGSNAVRHALPSSIHILPPLPILLPHIVPPPALLAVSGPLDLCCPQQRH